jgi:dTDP-4-amino-4,6-dideoxygalactose transaminase
MINVTQTFFPLKEEYEQQLQRVWDNQWLTNRGELVRELEGKLQNFLSSEPKPTLTANGTLPLQMALKKLAKNGEVITTPFSYVATTSSIVWQDCTPVFVDIHPNYLTIDETKIEEAITEKTTAILATHVYGNPCAVEEIQRIADKNNLKVIYDAAHCFGVSYKGKSIFDFGDVSTCSFHATKLFHTGEGGAMFCKNKDLARELFLAHNFGHDGRSNFTGVGINAKMSELHAAMGLSVLPYMKMILENRKKAVRFYRENLNFDRFSALKIREGTEWNFSYYPIVFETEKDLLRTQKQLNAADIFPRRYFYPPLHQLNYVSSPEMPVAESISPRVLCLPLAHNLTEKQLKKITSTVNKSL